MPNIELFSFGNHNNNLLALMDAVECVSNGTFYIPPVSPSDLVSMLQSGVHHASALQAKLNILKGTFEPTPLLSRAEFEKCAFNYLVIGNAYLEAVRAISGNIIRFENRLAMYMRRHCNLIDFIYLRESSPLKSSSFEYIQGKNVVHIFQPDLRQEIYGVPYYLSALNSIELNASATRFRRRYFDNGSHAGFILYTTDSQINEEDWDKVKTQLKESKGHGNFKNLFLRSPNGNPDGLKLIPISEVAAKDEFLNIKNVSAEDMLTIHRVPPKLMSIVPKGGSSLGDARTDAEVFATNEVLPLQQQFININETLNLEIFKFKPYTISAGA